MPNKRRWIIAPPVPPVHLAQFSSLPPLLVQLLYNRGVRSAADVAAFLHPTIDDANPFLLTGMADAVSRIRQAVRRNEPIAIYGDYDVDGVTATALLVQTLRALGADVRPYIPHRVEEGYGLNMTAMENLTRTKTRLVVTVDCGVRSVQEVAYARQLGIDVIITDHHSLGPALPEACAIINPRQPAAQTARTRYPFDELAGVGLAFRLAQALLRAERQVPVRRGDAPLPDEQDLLDLVALGTVADVVPLRGENRALVWHGLQQINAARRPGIRAMLAEAGLTPGAVTAYHIGYVLGPRLNAAGRLANAIAAYNLLMAETEEEAEALARELGERNRERQELTRELVSKAQAQVLSEGVGPILIVAGEEYLAGVVGLVASRLADTFYRPAVVVEWGESQSKGSARSIPEFHITQALDGCAELLIKHGGHAAAAGFTIDNAAWEQFTAQLRQIAAAQLASVELTPQLEVDAVIPLAQADWATAAMLEEMEPVGHANPRPCFVSRNVMVRQFSVVGNNHLRLTLSDGRIVINGIAFGQGAWASHMPPRIDVAYNLAVDEWNNERRLQLHVQDLRPAGTPD